MTSLPCFTDVQTAAQAEDSSRKNGKRKHSGSAFIALCDDFSNARIELDAEVFSGFQMVALLLDEIEHFLHRRCGSIKGVLKLLANRGIELTERTLKDYITRARKLKGTEKGEAIAKLRESIIEEARRSGRVLADRASAPSGSQEEGAPAASGSMEAGTPCDEAEWGTLDGGWLNGAVLQAMEQDEPQEQHKQDEQKAQQERKAKDAGASSAKKDKMAKKRAKRRARLSR